MSSSHDRSYGRFDRRAFLARTAALGGLGALPRPQAAPAQEAQGGKPYVPPTGTVQQVRPGTTFCPMELIGFNAAQSQYEYLCAKCPSPSQWVIMTFSSPVSATGCTAGNPPCLTSTYLLYDPDANGEHPPANAPPRIATSIMTGGLPSLTDLNWSLANPGADPTKPTIWGFVGDNVAVKLSASGPTIGVRLYSYTMQARLTAGAPGYPVQVAGGRQLSTVPTGATVIDSTNAGIAQQNGATSKYYTVYPNQDIANTTIKQYNFKYHIIIT